MRTVRSSGLALVAGLVLAFVRSPAARGADPSAVRPEWGTKDRVLTHVAFSDFLPDSSATAFAVSPKDGPAGFGIYSSGFVHAVARVPSGALLTYLELDFYDDNAGLGEDVVLALYDCSFHGGDCHLLQAVSSADAPSPGARFAFEDLTPQGITIDNDARELVLEATTNAGDASTVLNGAYIGYKLQISPAPAAATFADVPKSHVYFRAIEALAASGITGGCGNGNFCPAQNVTRGEMAVFLARALGLHFPN
ncbi:MAG TPA: S-layer homology domain-containing protein [Thermoanaerobaculia bacterium]|jgi:hypothetical protein